MKIFALVILVLIAGISFTAAQSKNEETKKETKQTEIQHDHSAKKGCGSSAKSCCSKESTTEVINKAWNSICPIKGGEVDYEVTTVEYNGKYYGFCCPGCEDKFSSDPDNYSKNLSEDGQSFTGKI